MSLSTEIGFDRPQVDRPWNQERAQCTSINRHGERCRMAAIAGGNICVQHGGKTPDVIAKAKRRLLAMVEPAFDVLDRATRSAPPCPSCGRSDSDRDPVALNAAKTILDRAGFGKHSKITIEHETTGPSAMEWLTHEERVKMMTLYAAARMRMQAGQPPTDAIEGEVLNKSPIQSSVPQPDDDVVHTRDVRQQPGRRQEDLTPEQVARMKKKLASRLARVARLEAQLAAEEASQNEAANKGGSP
jgi:hypothetical protein